MRTTLIGVALCLACMHAEAQNTPGECRSMASATGLPVVKPLDSQDTMLCRDGYLLLHSDARKTPYWVLERLEPGRFVGEGDRKEQGDPFATDPDLKQLGRAAATPDDYLNQKSQVQKRKFDRGHMAPAADMKFTKEATTQSFFMSNMAPQHGINLNRHIWADLEALVRDWACDRRNVYVFTGPIYDEQPQDTLGPSNVAVPTAFYKIVYEPRQKRALSFILPNEAIPKQGRRSLELLEDFRAPVREVEARTGIRFFGKLEARKRRQLVDARAPMWMVVRGCQAED
jgi:endonuclease G